MSSLFDHAAKFFHELQADICGALSDVDGTKQFGADAWQRPGGGGGVTRVLEGGALFEKAGVSWSNVDGDLPTELADHMPGTAARFARVASHWSCIRARRWCRPRTRTSAASRRATRCGSVAAPISRRITFFATTPCTSTRRSPTSAIVIDQSAITIASRRRCDDYFLLPHRGETRGIGGVFFDYMGAKGEDVDKVFALVRELGAAFVPAYVPIATRRQALPFGDAERTWQLRRRARYVEFNLIYDRGTLFGLKTNGRIESILMSLPPLARWDYDVMPQPGSPEAELITQLRPHDWLGRAH